MSAANDDEPRRPKVDNSFGVCPTCRAHNGYLNIRRNHWFVCEVHRTTWFAGANIFFCWKDEDCVTWLRNQEKLRSFSIVEPAYDTL